jgi:phosphoribosylanthranilate isomerase
MTVIKICGLKTLQDSLATCEAGADMLGFNFYQESVRYIALHLCRLIVERVKSNYPQVLCVGIFVNHEATVISSIMRECHLDLAQLSGNETIDTLKELGTSAFKAIRSRSPGEARELIERLPTRTSPPAFLLDSYQSGAYGGTGKVGDFELAASISREHPILLAGGLDPVNVSSMVERIQPWGVDVASGVERVRGQKDMALVRSFIQAVRESEAININP